MDTQKSGFLRPGLLASLALFLSPGLTLLAGCSESGSRVTTNTVLSIPNCQSPVTGLTLIELADVAALRGTALLNEAGTALQAADAPLFVAISRGPQPTRGYELHLSDQAMHDDDQILKIPVFWTEPDAALPHPLVTTTPCLVVSVPRADWLSIEAVDQHGESLGELRPTAVQVPPEPG